MAGAFRYVSDREVADRWQKSSVKAQPRGARPEIARLPEVRNIEPVLTLGEVRYFAFRRHTYGVPPLPYKRGHAMLGVYTRTLALTKLIAERGDKSLEDEYYRNLDWFKSMFWRHGFRTGKMMRLMRRLHLLRNPFAMATEKEVLEIADFFLKGRTKSNVQFSLGTPALP